MVVCINTEAGAVEPCRKVVIATGVLAEAVGHLNHTSRISRRPFVESYFYTVGI